MNYLHDVIWAQLATSVLERAKPYIQEDRMQAKEAVRELRGFPRT